MTIGVGFLCSDGIVLCADRQITGQGYKFQQAKIFSIQRQDYTFVFTYAGDPDAARMMFEKTRDAMRHVTIDRESAKDAIKRTLEKIFANKATKGLQTLIGMRTKEEHFLIKTKEKKVVEGVAAEYIGAGDSSALRYLCDFLLDQQMSVSEALVLGSYIVSVAGRYVEYCGEDSNHATLYAQGGLVRGSGGPWLSYNKERFVRCEEEMGKGLRALLFSGATAQIEVKPSTSRKSKPRL